MSETESWIAAKNDEIRQGLGFQVRRELIERIRIQSTHPIPRAHAPAVAALCRRTGIHLYALLVLHRYVRPGARSPEKPSDAETLEYAGSLAQIWAEEEAFALLKKIPVERYPQADLFRAFAHFQRWEYDRAIPLLERYASSPRLDDYARLIGKVNLAAALVTETRSLEAREFLENVIEEAQGFSLLKGNLLEITAQNWINLRRFSEARQALEESKILLRQSGNLDSFFVEKWLAILDLYEKKSSTRKIAPEARERKHWETIREWDYYRGLIGLDRKILEHCYFGTPFSNYRRRIEKQSGLKFSDHFEWHLGLGSKKTLDLDGISEDWKPGQLIHRLFKILASDFYRPHHWVSLHSKLFPGRHLHPESSADAIHQLIKRARNWLATHHPEIEITESQSSYSLLAPHGAKILINLKPAIKREDPYLDLWKSSKKTTLSVREAMKLWNLNRHTTIRVFNQLIENCAAIREGAGPRTRYQIDSRAD